MISPYVRQIEENIAKSARLAAENREIILKVRQTVAESRSILAGKKPSTTIGQGSAVARMKTAPPDALCACFDALLEAAQQVEEIDDPELFALVERALLRAGERIEQVAARFSEQQAPVQ